MKIYKVTDPEFAKGPTAGAATKMGWEDQPVQRNPGDNIPLAFFKGIVV